MPGSDGKLTEQEMILVWTWLGDVWVHRNCTCCGSDTWVGGEHLLMDHPYTPPDRTIASAPKIVVAYVVAFCTNCAYSVRFNAHMIPGLLTDERGIGTRKSTNG